MDTLHVEDFYQGFEGDIHAIVEELSANQAWFFTLETVDDMPGVYIAHDDTGRYIGMAAGTGKPRYFTSDTAALKVALHYNNDILKIRRSGALSWRKDGKLNRGLM